MKISLLPSFLKPYYSQLSEMVSFANKSWYYSTSHFFSKVGAYEVLLNFQKGNRVNVRLIVGQISKYIINVNSFFFLYVISKFFHSLSGQRSIKDSEEIVYIDSYLIVNYAMTEDDLIGNYFPNLIETLENHGKKCAIIPRIYGSWSPFTLYQLFRRIRKGRYNVLMDYELLRFTDFVRLGVYLMIYPFKMIQFYRKQILPYPNNDYLKYFFWSDMNGSNFYGGVRYLFAQKLLKRLGNKDKVIQWYENQPYDKTLNRVVGESEREVEIYGCQLFFYAAELLNGYIDRNELKSHLPQQVLVNGSFYMEENDLIRKVGPSLRYRKLFQSPIYRNLNKDSLVLFSFFEMSNRAIIQVMNSLNGSTFVNLKLHPSCLIEDYQSRIDFPFKLRNEDIYELFEETEFVIGAASGALVEAIACGIPVLVLADQGIGDYSYLPDFCRGTLWDIVWNKESIDRCYRELKIHVLRNSTDRNEMIRRVREEMFSEPSTEKVLEAFGLN